MGVFDRLTGKEMEASVEEYTQTYGEVLIGMHQKLKQQGKQIDNIRHQIGTPSSTNLIESIQTSGQIKDDISHLHSLLTQHKKEISNKLTVLENESSTNKERNQTVKQELEDKLHQMNVDNEQLVSGIKKLEEEAVHIRKEQKLIQGDVSKHQNSITSFDQEIRSLKKQLHSNVETTKLLTNQLNQEVEQRENEFQQLKDLYKKQQDEHNNEIRLLNKRFKVCSWCSGIALGSVVIWELIINFVL